MTAWGLYVILGFIGVIVGTLGLALIVGFVSMAISIWREPKKPRIGKRTN